MNYTGVLITLGRYFFFEEDAGSLICTLTIWKCGQEMNEGHCSVLHFEILNAKWPDAVHSTGCHSLAFQLNAVAAQGKTLLVILSCFSTTENRILTSKLK